MNAITSFAAGMVIAACIPLSARAGQGDEMFDNAVKQAPSVDPRGASNALMPARSQADKVARVVPHYTVFLDPPTGFVFVRLPSGWKFVGQVDPKDVARAPTHVVTAMLVDAEDSVATNAAAAKRGPGAQQ